MFHALYTYVPKSANQQTEYFNTMSEDQYLFSLIIMSVLFILDVTVQEVLVLRLDGDEGSFLA